MARDIFGLSTSASLRRIEFNRWELLVCAVRNPTVRFLCSAVARNVDRNRRWWLRANVPPISETQGTISQEDGPVLQMPSGNEMIPEVLHFSLPLSPPLGIAGTVLESQRGKNSNATMPN